MCIMADVRGGIGLGLCEILAEEAAFLTYY